MPHVSFAAFTGFRIREPEMRALGMSLPGLSARAKAIAELPALGVLTLAGLTPDPWTCSYHGISRCTDEAVEQILSEQPDLVAVSALTASINEAYEFSDRLQSRGITVLMGGLHVTACSDEASQHCDAVVVGRGESVWQQILDDVRQQQLKLRYEATPGTPPLWPLPRFDLLGHQPARFTMQTQTGCPFACGFCGSSRLLGRFYEKPLENIRRELQVLAEIRPKPLIELADDNTFAGTRDASALLDELQRSGARWFTEADWRIGERPEILRRLAASGCVQVLVGIESLVFRYPGMGDKQAELQRVMDAVAAIQQAGVVVNGCFIAGADGETFESLDRLVRFINDSVLAEVQVTLQTPFPGTALHHKLAAEGRLLQERGWSAYSLFDVSYRPDLMTVAELESGFRQVLKHVYAASESNRRNRIRREIMQQARRERQRESTLATRTGESA